MAQIRLAGLEAKVSKKRERLRKRVYGETAAEKRKLRRLTKRKLGRRLNVVEQEKRATIKGTVRERRREVRRKIARAMEQEEIRRAFKTLGVTRKKRKRRIEARTLIVKAQLIRELDPEMSKAKARKLARTAQMQFRAESVVRTEKFKGYVKEKGRWYPAERKKVKGVWEVRRTGGRVKVSTINRSVAAKAYWKRVKAVKKAFGISLKQARKLDTRLLEVPESVRVRIYEKFKRRA
jgi:hypothetical protein